MHAFYEKFDYTVKYKRTKYHKKTILYCLQKEFTHNHVLKPKSSAFGNGRTLLTLIEKNKIDRYQYEQKNAALHCNLHDNASNKGEKNPQALNMQNGLKKILRQIFESKGIAQLKQKDFFIAHFYLKMECNLIMHFRKQDCFHLTINSWRVFFFQKIQKTLGFKKKNLE